MFKRFIKWLKDQIVMDFSETHYPPECFDCNRGHCHGCHLATKYVVDGKVIDTSETT